MSAFPQIEAFINDHKNNPSHFEGLKVKYVRGSYPVLRLMDEDRTVVQTLSIDKWNTQAVQEFLDEKLRK